MSSQIKVTIDAGLAAGFRRRAICKAKLNQEYVEIIFVERVGIGYYVHEMHKVKILNADEYTVEYDIDQAEELARVAAEKGYLMSSIHTHLDYEPPSAPSINDILGCKIFNDPLIGILDIHKRETGRYWSQLTFWLPVYPCETEIIK